jgi:hypothetical protein
MVVVVVVMMVMMMMMIWFLPQTNKLMLFKEINT